MGEITTARPRDHDPVTESLADAADAAVTAAIPANACLYAAALTYGGPLLLLLLITVPSPAMGCIFLVSADRPKAAFRDTGSGRSVGQGR